MKLLIIVSIIVLIIIFMSIGSYFFEKNYIDDVSSNFISNNNFETDLLTEKDIENLPLPVQNYLNYVGVIGKAKVKNTYIVLEGEMRNREKDYFPFSAEQYNFYENPSRLFFMKAKIFAMTVPGYHRYMDKKASMDIKLFGLLSVVKVDGETMNKAETVTIFNDICIMAPALLIDKRITWEEIDDSKVKGTFTNGDIVVSATLHFNLKGQLVNFISDDRTDVSDMKQYRFSTPISKYKNINGYNLATYGEAIWHYPDGEFVYGKLNIKEVKYNVSE